MSLVFIRQGYRIRGVIILGNHLIRICTFVDFKTFDLTHFHTHFENSPITHFKYNDLFSTNRLLIRKSQVRIPPGAPNDIRG